MISELTSSFMLFICLAATFGRISGEKQTNFVIIVADDLGIGDLGCFGNTSLKTPNVDRIANEGAKFTHNLAAAEVCTPSRAALLTGRYPVRSGMSSSNFNRVLLFLASMGGLPWSEITFPKLLQQRGYSTALIGKWHLGLHCMHPFDFCHHPSSHGFDYFYGLPWSTCKDFGGEEELAVDRQFPKFVQFNVAVSLVGLVTVLWLRSRLHWIFILLVVVFVVIIPLILIFLSRNLHMLNGVVMRDFDVVEQPVRLKGLVRRFVEEAKSFLVNQTESSKPFLLMMPLTHVHTALTPTHTFRGSSSFGLYGDFVQEMDWAVGQVLDQLDRLKLTEDTFVLFTSDQGGHVEEKAPDGSRGGGFNGIYRGGKGMGGMDGALRVPTLIRWPAKIKPGLVISTPTSLMDIFPTIADIIQETTPSDRFIDGTSLLPLLSGSVPNDQQNRFLVHYCGSIIHAVRYTESEDAIWKVHYYSPGWLPGKEECTYICPCYGKGTVHHEPPLVYNIAKDVEERNPINATDPKVKDIMDIVREKLVWHSESIARVSDQFNVLNTLWLPWLQPCCNFPYCNCKEEKYSHILQS